MLSEKTAMVSTCDHILVCKKHRTNDSKSLVTLKILQTNGSLRDLVWQIYVNKNCRQSHVRYYILSIRLCYLAVHFMKVIANRIKAYISGKLYVNNRS